MTRETPKFYLIEGLWIENGLQLVDYRFEKYPSVKKIIRRVKHARKQGLESLAIDGEVLQHPTAQLMGTADCWPAVIPPYSYNHPLAFREDVVKVIEAGNLTGFKFRRLRIKGLSPRRLWFKRRPAYYDLQPAGTIETFRRVYDTAESPWRLVGEGKDFTDPVLSSLAQARGRQFRVLPVLDSWNGSDAIVNPNAFLGGFYSTLEFVELIRKMGWQGFSASPLDAWGDRCVDVLQRPWPPSRWYPAGLPD